MQIDIEQVKEFVDKVIDKKIEKQIKEIAYDYDI